MQIIILSNKQVKKQPIKINGTFITPHPILTVTKRASYDWTLKKLIKSKTKILQQKCRQSTVESINQYNETRWIY